MSNHSFDIHIATEYKSVEIAILVWHFHYWIMKNKRLGRNNIDGRTWTYQTYEEITAFFPYWSRDQVKRLLKKSVELKLLIKNNFNTNKYDQTVWYAFENEEKFGISRFREMENLEEECPTIGRNRPIEKTISPDQKGGIALPIPDTIPNTLTNKEREEAAPPGISSFFYEKLKSINPKIKKPNLEAWEKELQKLMKDGNGNSPEEIMEVINYIISTRNKPSSNGFCWASVVLSAVSLRKNYAKIWAEMKNITSEKKEPQTPYDKVSRLFKNEEKYNNATCYLTKESISFERGTRNESIKLDKYFHWTNLEKLCDSFQIKMEENDSD